MSSVSLSEFLLLAYNIASNQRIPFKSSIENVIEIYRGWQGLVEGKTVGYSFNRRRSVKKAIED